MTESQLLTLDQITARAEEEQVASVNFKQVKLTKKFLLPRLREIEADMLALRSAFDQTVDQQSDKYGKRYPEGFCQEITLGVKQLLENELPGTKRPGLLALREFITHGGLAKRIWGNLRNQYFQNAFQFGSLYVDVANDTVKITKPKIEVLPLAKARMFPISDYDGYADIAEKYWKGKVYPNRILPDLAVMFPLFLVKEGGQIELHANYQTILYRNMQFDFALAEKFLFKSRRKDLVLPKDHLDRLIAEHGASSETLADEVLKQYFDSARQSELRFDTKRCQALLDRVIAL
ncbi:hypothetical protein [Thalassospira sp.]|uniref:hypothetical protein n=1 Tax=Thalassospira sp. TaxID=1912094 RepID=UPI000C4E2434|nr:hypothetical protein [Thalassospira sp.]MBC08055.1 hypothetical protein [Thalassospira sp.]|tara:strand:+ start:214 stop:1086 length:873 start_codon:yes stop_codon:yes gene_type:complete